MLQGPSRHSTAALGIAIAILGAVAWGGGALPARASAAGAAPEESSMPPGRDALERLSTVSQFDALGSTTTDSVRSMSAACLAAYLLLGGDFAAAARPFDIGGKPSYGNLHRLQDALHRQADRDGEPGLRASASANYDTSDVFVDWSMRGDDELHRVLEPLGLRAERLYGPSRSTETQKGERLMTLLTEDSTRVFLVGLLRDEESGTLHALPEEGLENHYVLVMWRDNGFQVLDTARPPGTSMRSRWSDETAGAMLFDTHDVVYWLRR